jgi:hypothetical protein
MCEKSMQEIMEEYDRLNNIPEDVTHRITHPDFVEGARKGSVGFKMTGGESVALLRGLQKAIFNILVMLYMFAPFILIPVWSYLEGNGWLLLGLPVPFFATRSAANSMYVRGKQNLISFFLIVGVVAFLFFKGAHNYYSFFSSCAAWGYVLFCVADRIQDSFAMRNLVKDPVLFHQAIADGRIMVVRKRES